MRPALSVFAALSIVALPLLSCTSTANVSDVWMSIDDDGARRRTVFFADSASVVCIAEVGVGRRDVTVEMFIRQIREVPPGTGGSEFQETNRVVAANEIHPGPTSGGRPALLALKMVPSTTDASGNTQENDAAPFGPGSYRCEVVVDGKPAGETAFNIRYADCPPARIVKGQACAGFYATDPPTACPAGGATSGPEPSCTCGGPNGWDCPQ
jgi:hypothetical protein